MRVPPLLAALLATSCTIEALDRAGAECRSTSDCEDPAYRCSPDVEGVRRCLAVFPSDSERDAGAVEDAGEPAYWCGEVEPIMVAHCAGCHVPGGDAGTDGFRLDRYEDSGAVSGAREMAPRIHERMVRFKDMPPFYATLFPDDPTRAVVGRWVAHGAPFCADGGTP